MDQDFLATAFAMESCEDEDDPDRTDEWGWPLLHAALSTSHFDVAMSLLQKGARFVPVYLLDGCFVFSFFFKVKLRALLVV
jgi:hypothetical protein